MIAFNQGGAIVLLFSSISCIFMRRVVRSSRARRQKDDEILLRDGHDFIKINSNHPRNPTVGMILFDMQLIAAKDESVLRGFFQ